MRLLDRATDLFGDAPATVAGGDVVSYQALAERIRGLAGGLASLDIGVGDVVGVLMMNSSMHLETSFAVPAVGAVLGDLSVRLPVPDLALQ